MLSITTQLQGRKELATKESEIKEEIREEAWLFIITGGKRMSWHYTQLEADEDEQAVTTKEKRTRKNFTQLEISHWL